MSSNEDGVLDLDIDVDSVLAERAERLARGGAGADERKLAYQIALLAVGSERFGIPASGLREIVAAPPVAALPGLPAYLQGVSQIRGDLICIVDLAKLMDIEGVETTNALAIVEGAQGAIGLLADEVLGFRDVHSDELAEGFVGASRADNRPVEAMTKDLVAIIDLERLLESGQLVVDQVQ